MKDLNSKSFLLTGQNLVCLNGICFYSSSLDSLESFKVIALAYFHKDSKHDNYLRLELHLYKGLEELIKVGLFHKLALVRFVRVRHQSQGLYNLCYLRHLFSILKVEEVADCALEAKEFK